MQTVIEITREEAIFIFGFIMTAMMDPTTVKETRDNGQVMNADIKAILNDMAGELQACTTAKGAQLVVDLTMEQLKAIKSVVEHYKDDNDPVCGKDKTGPLLRKLDVLMGI